MQKAPWAVHYAVTEVLLVAEATLEAYDHSTEDSKARIVKHLKILYPEAFNNDLGT